MKKNLVRSISAFSIMACVLTTALIVNQARAAAITTTDGDESSAIEEDVPDFMDKVEGAVENIDNGVVITVTSDDPVAVEKIQTMPSDGGPFDEMFDVDQTLITRTIELLDNGVKITLTSTDTTVVEKLQSQADEFSTFDFPEKVDVSRTVENIDNGVVVTITSDDADVVKLLQENGGKMHRFGDGENRGHGEHCDND